MGQRNNKILFALLRSAVCGTELEADIKKDITPELFEKLYVVSKRHDISHLIGLAIEKNGLLQKENEFCAKFQKQQMLAVFRYEHINYELGIISDALEKAQIPYMPLKGSVIRKYYPEEWMRTSCDVDILIHESDLEHAEEVFVQELGYREEGKGTHDVSFFSQNGVHIELHFELNEVAFRVFDVLSNVWSCSQAEAGYHYIMPDDVFYFYHIAHMAKHFNNGGCGIRPFIDLWILDNINNADAERRDRLLEQGGLLKFARSVQKLSRVWLENEEADPVSLQMEYYILTGGVYGTNENRITVQQQKKGGKFKYALSKIFIPYEIIKFQYPILQKHRWLTPFMEVRRWCKLIFRGHAKRTLKELKYNQNVSVDTADKTKNFLQSIGL